MPCIDLAPHDTMHNRIKEVVLELENIRNLIINEQSKLDDPTNV